MSEVWESELPQGQKFVLLAMADHANDEGRNAYPSIARLAERCSVDQRTVQRTLRALEASGYLVVERAAKQHSPTSYRVIPRGGIMSGRHNVGAALNPPGVALCPPRGGITPPNPSGTVRNRPIHKERRRPSKRCPEDFRLDADLVAYAAKKGMPAAELDEQFEAFRDHEYKDAHTDWPACWRTWCRNYTKFNAPAAPRGEPPSWKNSRAPVEPVRVQPPSVTPDSDVRAYQERRRRERQEAAGG